MTNGIENISSCIKFNLKRMIPFDLMVDVAMTKQYCADNLLITHFKFVFMYCKVRNSKMYSMQ